MQGPQRIVRALYSVGYVHRVDTVNRELTVLVDGALLIFDVPVGCAVILHGEPVKLRMVQPRDRVRITHLNRGNLRIARTIEVQPERVAGRASLDLSQSDQPTG